MYLRALFAAATLAFAASAAHADVTIRIDKSTQRMTVAVDGQTRYVWPVSTGIARYDTPDGDFRPFRMEKDHFSKEWDDAPMPYSIFFTKQGHAIHGTNHTSIGRPASHGCVRLSVANAAKLWELVTEQGMSKTKVVLTGELPTSDLIAKRQDQRRYGNDETTGSASTESNVPGYPRYYSNDNNGTYAQQQRTYTYDNGYYAQQQAPRTVYRQQQYPYYQQQPAYREAAPAPYPFWFGGR
jgi:hypothetical protein